MFTTVITECGDPAESSGPCGFGGSHRKLGVARLDDEDFPALSMGQAAELLGVQPAFLRSLDAAEVLRPGRSSGGHRRYSRRELVLASRIRALFDEGLSLDAAHRIVMLEDQLEGARQRITELEQRLGERGWGRRREQF